ncbi:cytosine permease [Zhihengliuella sp.]|uniref:purine-cytosine permease family protein n=1 Tax=Zhihengliuella sp. TaxID=1954483 RepID=UPI0028127C21|nr:cytosine permease [Zhihengliuella sp.]
MTEQAAPPRTDAASANAPGHVERHGIDFIAPEERGGSSFSLFWIWMSANVLYLYFVIGGGLVLLGLSVVEALAVTVVGNLWWAVVGWLAVSGPSAGAPSVTIMRAMFGIRGNRIFGGALGVLIGLFYEIINIAVGTFAALALLPHLGVELGMAGEWSVLLVVAFLSFVFSVYGHGTIMALSPYFSGALALAFVVLGYFVLTAADFGYTAPELPTGERWAMIALGYAIVASGPLSWGTGADYSRYLPERTPRRGIIWWTALGGFIPAVLIGGLGVLAATAIDMTDPQQTIGEIVPAWFTPVFLFVVFLGTVTNNVLVAYSTGLYAQGLGIRLPRATTVVVTGTVATVLGGWLVFGAPSFLDTLNAALELSVCILGPLVAIYAVDIVLRRNRYDGRALNDERPGSEFWYRHGYFAPGVVAMVVGAVVSLLFVNSTLFVGPVAAALGGADLSALLAPVVGGLVYAILWRYTAPYNDPARRPGATAPRPERMETAA